MEEKLLCLFHIKDMIIKLENDIKNEIEFQNIDHQQWYINMKLDQLNFFIQRDNEINKK